MSQWHTVALINPFYQDGHGVFQSDVPFGDVVITKKPSWIDNNDNKINFGLNQRRMIEDAALCFMTNYEAESLGEPDPSWQKDKQRSKQHLCVARIMLCNEALWLSQPTSLNFQVLLHIEKMDQEYTGRGFSTYPAALPHKKDGECLISQEDVQKAQILFSKICSLHRKGSTWIALHNLWSALTAPQGQWIMRYLLLWIALEALFGSDIEITHRLSERISFFIADDRSQAKELYEKSKHCYRWRSKIVHGNGMNKLTAEDSEKIMHNSENLVRSALKKILLDDDLINTFSGNGREKYLDELIFS